MRLTDLLHKETMSTAKRLAKKSAFVATIRTNGKVELSHARHETIHMSSRDELHQWIASNGLNKFDVLIIDIVNAQGKQPIEL